ncbi:hypothetical protein BGW80DRAFT_1273856 [Lactifluus volemus]|nr:hypothetical protein BGW80DRAFT_1273856 [Lactifluus volemus]
MASTSAIPQVQRSQADPLPPKRGEIGFIEGVHDQPQAQAQEEFLPERHPADQLSPTPPSSDPTNNSPSASESPSTPSSGAGKPSFHKKLPKFLGVQFGTLALLVFQSLLLIGTILAWVFATLALIHSKPSDGTPANAFTNQDPNPTTSSGSGGIFVHVAFTIMIVVQLALIERRIFRFRAERYAFKHPGEMSPTLRLHRLPSSNSSMPIAPWSRPSLPTYAAALVAGGVATGDVEDVEIAQPPPPAYGKTRGSTLLLAGYLSDNLRVQARQHEQDRRMSGASLRSDRPASFLSHDEEWEVRRDADRARRIEEALAALEEGESTPRITSRPMSGITVLDTIEE